MEKIFRKVKIFLWSYNFFSFSSCQEKVSPSQKGKDYPWVFNQQYHIGFMHEARWSQERLTTYKKRITTLMQSLNNDRVLLIRWDMKAPFHNDPTHAEHEQRDRKHFNQTDSISNIYAIKDFCNDNFSGQVDLLIFHADKIKSQNKRPDVLYHYIDFDIAKIKGKAKEWDRTAIKEALLERNIELKTPPHKSSLLNKIINFLK